MIPHRFNNGFDAAVTDAKTLPGRAVDKCLAGSGSVEGDIADDDTFLRGEGAARRGKDNDSAA
jgi:hypothetical protein